MEEPEEPEMSAGKPSDWQTFAPKGLPIAKKTPHLKVTVNKDPKKTSSLLMWKRIRISA